MASVLPDLRLPFQSQNVTAVQLVPDWSELYCLLTEADVCVCEQLAKGRYLAVERFGVELATSCPLTIKPPGHEWRFNQADMLSVGGSHAWNLPLFIQLIAWRLSNDWKHFYLFTTCKIVLAHSILTAVMHCSEWMMYSIDGTW